MGVFEQAKVRSAWITKPTSMTHRLIREWGAAIALVTVLVNASVLFALNGTAAVVGGAVGGVLALLCALVVAHRVQLLRRPDAPHRA